jgi:hypothetical protein
MALSTVVGLSVAANIANALDVGTASANLQRSYGASLTDGAAAGMANVAWWSSRTLTASSTETLDFAGTLLDRFGAVITFARLKVLVVYALPTNTNNVIIGGGTTTFTGLFGATTHTTILRPGTVWSVVTGVADAIGYAVTAGSTDLLQVANSSSGSSVVYEIAAIGCAT